MRTLTILFCLLTGVVFSQYEFDQYPNGLIYSDIAMANLGKIIGEENERFRQCELSKNFKAVSQTTADVYRITGTPIRFAKRDLWADIDVSEFEHKYQVASSGRVLAVKRVGTDYEGKEHVYIDAYPGIELRIPKSKWPKSNKGLWVFTKDHSGELIVLRLATKFQTVGIPYNYARMIQYSECLVDTTQQLYTYAVQPRVRTESPEEDRVIQLFDYIDHEFGETAPEWTEDMEQEEYEKLSVSYQQRLEYFMDRELSKTPGFRSKLDDAYHFAISYEASSYSLEELVEKYMGKKEALLLKRSRRVYGMCSMDTRPRYHAVNIAQLAAESFSWDVFLRAHLDILNDNFSRASDGNYAWAARQTYVKEMEMLNIEVGDLLLGITFRIQNPSSNHYYGNIRRLGRAINEAEDKEQILATIERGIADQSLDVYNRMLLFYLFANVQYQSDLLAGVEFNKEKVEATRALLPSYLHTLDY